MDKNGKSVDNGHEQRDIPEPERLSWLDKLELKLIKKKLNRVLKNINKEKKKDLEKTRKKLEQTVIIMMELIVITEMVDGKEYELTAADVKQLEFDQLVRYATEGIEEIKGLL